MAQEPEQTDPIVIFADRTVGLGFHGGVIRIGLAAMHVDRQGQDELLRTGMLALTVEGALELQASLHQLLSQLDKHGVVDLKPPRQDG